MVYKLISNAAELEAAKAAADKYVFFNIVEGAFERIHADRLAEYSDKHAATTDTYAVNASATPDLKAALGVDALPAAVIYKNGADVKTISPLNRETSQAEIEATLTS
ncbi:hypothetical protein HII31_12735 [Pseudocercospora fuligena]|uniref:Thioredoxin domain-containing protein n=1 Tax=Pseudocercospora fuligena TaxID=685502 RepID=A0A8H6VCS2_9PEZI|nr:hypothetical protein HII31_12735 [Pseudocercospora fuligena]